MDDGAVGIGPVVPLGLWDAQKGRIVVLVLPAVAQDEIGPQPLSIEHAQAQVVRKKGCDVLQRVGHELLRVRHGGPHLILQRVKRGGVRRAAPAHRNRKCGRLTAHFVQQKFHFQDPPK